MNKRKSDSQRELQLILNRSFIYVYLPSAQEHVILNSFLMSTMICKNMT